ncbi:hypothetical protein SDC9_185113 [bioreactor metagenome]|uniref:Uncharacterized protein n=1 Tax=bioreactor metagenome TaxID=1076179 RepID=A0A645HQF2_9ZZZZ
MNDKYKPAIKQNAYIAITIINIGIKLSVIPTNPIVAPKTTKNISTNIGTKIKILAPIILKNFFKGTFILLTSLYFAIFNRILVRKMLNIPTNILTVKVTAMPKFDISSSKYTETPYKTNIKKVNKTGSFQLSNNCSLDVLFISEKFLINPPDVDFNL